MVDAAIPGSPAHKSDIRNGSEIGSINGVSPGLSCAMAGWEFERLPGFTILAIRRVRVIKVALVPYDKIFVPQNITNHDRRKGPKAEL